MLAKVPPLAVSQKVETVFGWNIVVEVFGMLGRFRSFRHPLLAVVFMRLTLVFRLWTIYMTSAFRLHTFAGTTREISAVSRREYRSHFLNSPVSEMARRSWSSEVDTIK